MNTTTDIQPSPARNSYRQNLTRVWLIIAVLAPAVIAFWILHRQQFSLPYQDDNGAILDFATAYRQMNGPLPKLVYALTRQDNDYKLAFEHLIVALEIELTGHVNLGFLVTLGNFFLLAIGYVLWRLYRREEIDLNRQLLEFIPVSLLFFSLTYWESVDWAMAGLQNLPVILFSILSLCFLTPKRSDLTPSPMLFLSCVSAILASLSSANGFLLAPVGLLILCRRRLLAAASVWCAAFLVPVAVYLYHYQPYNVSVGTIHNGAYLAKACYFFAFLGCAIHERDLAALTGVAVSIVFALALWQKSDRTNPGAFYSMLWITMTAGLVGFVRQTIAPRYSIYSLLAIIFCYCFLAQYVPDRSVFWTRNRFYTASILLALVFCAVNDWEANVHLKERREMVVGGMENDRATPIDGATANH